ncbi:hypothetical protein HGR_16168, partial [Hylemonella gracilis ATCC 19624]
GRPYRVAATLGRGKSPIDEGFALIYHARRSQLIGQIG